MRKHERKLKISIILPAYNDSGNLRRNFKKIYKAASKLGNFEIIISENASKDDTVDVARRLSRLSRVRMISSPIGGRGGAVKRAVAIADGDIIGYMDVDLAVPIKYLAPAVRKIEEGNDVVAGTRYGGARLKRNLDRLIASKAYNLLIDLVTGSRLNDHQCGFKFWKKEFIKREARVASDSHWFFDTETLLDAQRMGKRIYMLPVSWTEQRSTTVKKSDVVYYLKIMFAYVARKGRV
ncbi:MAG: glycosyltransferase [Candidatus Micrarchaeota archaeon]|nr:glycosyltransferase [Candidatus Micrarchaeota archaeon]